MPKIEILFYSPNNLDEFIDFCIRGKEVSKGVAAKDEDGRDIFGVISWLNGWGVTEAHFFHTPKGHPMTFFMALVHKRDGDDEERPWFITDSSAPPKIILEPDIPGIDKVLRVDGELGILDAPQPLNVLLAAIKPDPDLDKEFAAQRARVLEALKGLEGNEAGRKRFFEALRGERGSKGVEVFKALNFSLRG
jgi:hypothetical protein